MSFVLYKKIDYSLRRPPTALYISFFLLSLITINTYFLVFFDIQYRYLFWALLAVGYLVSIFSGYRFKPLIEATINLTAFVVFIFYIRKIAYDLSNFGPMFGLILCWFFVLRSYLLFNVDDFRPIFIWSLPLIILCAIPSYESNYVISLQMYMVMMVVSLYLLSRYREIDEVKGGWSEVEKYRKAFKPKAEFKSVIGFLLLVLVGSSAIYLLMPRYPERPVNYRSIFRGIITRGGSQSPVAETSITTSGGEPYREIAEIYSGFNPDEFIITEGKTIREGPKANEVVMEVRVGYPRYMRAMVWDVYTGRGWERSLEIRREYKLSGLEEFDGELNLQRYTLKRPKAIEIGALRDNQVHYEGTVYLAKRFIPSTFLFLPWQTVSVSIPTKNLWASDAGEVTLSHPNSAEKRYLQNIRAYRFSATTYFPSGIEASFLKEKAWGTFLEHYTELPDKSKEPINGKTVKELAERIVRTANAETDYEKTVAIYKYLKTVGKYSLSPPSVPQQYDTVSYFLLEVEPKRGHCEIFSSAMVVMLRSLGIPARVATGYAPGTYSFTRNRYVIREKDAHAWVEVFFPEIGWIEFDPTPTDRWGEVNEKITQTIASASNFINELYVYDPKTFYNNRIKPISVKISSAIVSIALTLNKATPAWIKLYYPIIVAVILLLAALMIIVRYLKFLKKTEKQRFIHSTQSYYRNIVQMIKSKGITVFAGDTPYELLLIIRRYFSDSYEAAKAFIDDFQTIIFAPEFMHEEPKKRIKENYYATMESLKKSRSYKKQEVSNK